MDPSDPRFPPPPATGSPGQARAIRRRLMERVADADTSQLVSPTTPCAMPTLDRQRLVFAGAPIRWAQWVEFWERDGRRPHEATLLEAYRTRSGTSSRAG